MSIYGFCSRILRIRKAIHTVNIVMSLNLQPSPQLYFIDGGASYLRLLPHDEGDSGSWKHLAILSAGVSWVILHRQPIVIVVYRGPWIYAVYQCCKQ